MIGRKIRQYLKYIILGCCLLAVLLLQVIHNGYVAQLRSQSVAQRWGGAGDGKFTQVTSFFPTGQGLSLDDVQGLERQLGKALSDASLESDEEDGNQGRKLVDAYSVESTLDISNGTTGVSARAYGVSKDYFLFHPVELLYGHYFSADDDTEDGIILDENVAWKLFGAQNVVGMYVDIGDTSYVVRGVVRAEEGHFSKQAGENEETVFVDMKVLEHALGLDVPSTDDADSYGSDYGSFGMDAAPSLTVDTYELLIANPVSNFGVATMGQVLEDMGQSDYQLVENSTRFELPARFARIRSFGLRSMQADKIIYPYWENRARAYEDVSSLILVFQMLLLIDPIFMAGVGIVRLWKNKERIRHAIFRLFREKLFPFVKKLCKNAYNSRQSRKNKVV